MADLDARLQACIKVASEALVIVLEAAKRLPGTVERIEHGVLQIRLDGEAGKLEAVT